MNNFLQRVLLFIIALPLLLFIIIYFDPYSHLGWISLIIIISALGSLESLFLLLPYPRPSEKTLIPVLGTLLSAAAAAENFLSLPFSVFLLFLVFSIGLILLFRLISWSREELSGFTSRTALTITAFLYPGLFTAYLVRFAEFSSALPLMILFLILNFGNDTFSYLAGRFFGSTSKTLFAVSPKKTLIGYVGGFLGAIALGSIFSHFVPSLFASGLFHEYPALRILLYVCTAFFANVGDLIESALKRSVEKKDSGNFVPGRGGMLDSIDSLLFSAPFFYYSILIILG